MTTRVVVPVVEAPPTGFSLAMPAITAQGTPITELRSGVTRIGSPGSGELTMSSLEISRLTGKRHDHVMRDIGIMLAELQAGDGPNFGGIYVDALQREQPCYNLPRRETDILLTGYNIPARAKVIDRWHQLEAQVAKPVTNLNDPAELRGLLLGYTEQVLQLEAKIAEDAPKAKFHDQVAIAQNSHSMKQVADILKTGRNKLFKYLRKHGALLSDGINRNMPYQRHKEAGRFVVVETTRVHPKDESVVILDATTYVTGKGLIWIQQLIEQHGRAGL